MPAFNSADRIMRLSLKHVGQLQDGDNPTTDQQTDCLNILNDIVNFEQTQGLKLWLNYDLSITLVPNQALYTISPTGNIVMTKPMRVVEGYYADSVSNRRPLIPLSWDDWIKLSNSVNQGAVTSYFVKKNQLSLDVTFWLTPDTQAATGTAHLVIQQQAGQVVLITDTMSFPQEWFMFLVWALAHEKSSGQPQSVIDRCEKQKEFYRTALEDWDVEDTPTGFAPDTSMQLQNRSFI